MINRQDLLTDLQSLLRVVEADLRARSEDPELPEVNGWLRAEYAAAKEAGRTAQTFKSWVDDFITQVAAAWVLSCVFVRYLEDNSLVEPPRIAGPATAVGGGQSRLKRARDEYDHWVQGNRGMTDRDYLLDIFAELAQMPAAGEVFGEHNPLMALPNWLSGDAARVMLAFFQKVDADTGRITHDFTDPSGDTRFLGDLYQDLSEAARKKYALLQTPDFVEAFILDRTLEPALDEFGLEPAFHSGSPRPAAGRGAGGEGPACFKLIDPACGSGHFLLGAFTRILDRWQRKEPGEKVRVLVQRTLDSIHGVDVNPYAVAIARFRLLLAALAACECKQLKDSPNFEIHLACGDSLWHAPLRGQTGSASRGQQELPQFSPEAASETQQHTYFAEDAARLRRILDEGQYHCVVANPPYIVPRDAALNQDYRARYSSCHRQYSLAVPFMERIFRLAIPVSGYTGQITANSFMKREFGKKLIEEFLPTVDLTHVIDTSGAYIPGHGTPTTILFGRNRPPVAPTIRTVMGIKGEPSTPDIPAKGLVWSAIVDQIDRPGSESDFVSAGESERERFANHPWSIGGGGAAELKEQLDDNSKLTLSEATCEIGFAAISGEDNVFLIDRSSLMRSGLKRVRPLVEGEVVRDWTFEETLAMLWPNDDYGNRLSVTSVQEHITFLWPWREALKARKLFGVPVEQKGIPWWAVREVYLSKFATPLTITYAEVATHNHFVLDRGGKVFKQTAPVIKLPAEIEGEDGSRRPVTEDDHLALLGLLNSSTACFWMRQVSNCKGLGGQGGGIKPEAWHRAYAFNATNISKLPIPNDYQRCIPLTRAIVKAAERVPTFDPTHVLSQGTHDLRGRLNAAEKVTAQLYRELTALQEELDWLVYDLFGLTSYVPADPAGIEYGIHPEDRPCEVLLKKSIADGFKSIFYDVHRYRGADNPGDMHESTVRAIDARLQKISQTPDLRLVETPDYKRRWQFTSWESQVSRALQAWLLDRLESYFDFDGRMNDGGEPTAKLENELISVARLADIAAADAAFMEVAAVYRDDPAFNVARLVEELVIAQSVPLLPVLRYKPSGLRKREQWEETWELQREEDRLNGERRSLRDQIANREREIEATFVEAVAEIKELSEQLITVCRKLNLTREEPIEFSDDDTAETICALTFSSPGIDSKYSSDVQSVDLLRKSLARAKDALSKRVSQAANSDDKLQQLKQDLARLPKPPDIPVPPKYKSSDFISTGGARYWSLRGKLDVPKERWISFPHCPGSDGTLTICWAGYDHLQQALAISAHYQHIKEVIGGDDDPRLIPLLACIAELLPWLKQWHGEPSADYGGISMADYFEGEFLATEARALNQTIAEIKAWTPPQRTSSRGRKKVSK